MLDKPFPVLLDDQLTRLACIVILISSMAYRFLDWTVAGWIGLIFGILALFLAHELAVAAPEEEAEVASSVTSYAA